MKRRKMVKFSIDEISAVTRPAQSGARALIAKSKPKGKIEKGILVLTDPDSTDHQHLLCFNQYVRLEGGGTTNGATDPMGRYHDHPFTVDEDGKVDIGEALGHTHTYTGTMWDALAREASNILEQLHEESGETGEDDDYGKRDFTAQERQDAADSGAALPDGSFLIQSKKDLSNAIRAIGRAKDPAKAKAHIRTRAKALGAEDMLPDDWKGTISKEKDPMTEAERAQMAELTALASMNDAQKSHYGKLAGTDKAAFAKMNHHEREAAIVTHTAQDPIIYKSDATGREYRKSDNPELVSHARALDAQNVIIKGLLDKEKEKGVDDLVAKMGHIGKPIDEKRALAKNVLSIESEDVRKAAIDSLMSGKEQIEALMKTAGVRNVTAEPVLKAQDELDALAKNYDAVHKIGYHKAYDAVLLTPKGRQLYAETVRAIH